MKAWRWCVVMFLVGFAGSVSATELDEVLGGLSWGDPHLTVCKSVEDQIMADFKKAAEGVVDVGKRDVMRRKYESEFEHIKKTFRPLKDRKSSGLAVSIVQDEFLEANKEAVLVVSGDVMTRYFFFLDNQLYKVAISYQPEALSGVDFLQFVGLLAGRYGDDFVQNYSEDDYLESVVWEAGGTRLRVEDHSPIMKTYLVVFTDIALEAEVQEKHVSARVEREERWAQTSSELEGLTDDPEDPEETSAASEIVGEVKGVDVPEGVGPNGEKEGVDSGETGSKSGPEKKKRKRGSVKRKKGSKGFKSKDLKTSKENEPLIAF